MGGAAKATAPATGTCNQVSKSSFRQPIHAVWSLDLWHQWFSHQFWWFVCKILLAYKRVKFLPCKITTVPCEGASWNKVEVEDQIYNILFFRNNIQFKFILTSPLCTDFHALFIEHHSLLYSRASSQLSTSLSLFLSEPKTFSWTPIVQNVTGKRVFVLHSQDVSFIHY